MRATTSVPTALAKQTCFCILATIPHAWAFVDDTQGRMLIALAPANKMEAFFRDNEKRRKDGEYLNDAQVYPAYGLELLGPPLSLG